MTAHQEIPRHVQQAVVDEVQRAPALLLAIKESVDQDPRPGRFLLHQLPPWSHKAVSRLTKTPKLHFVDTVLLAALRGVTAAQLHKVTAPERASWGPLLENFVVSEVLKLITWSGKRLRVSLLWSAME